MTTTTVVSVEGALRGIMRDATHFEEALDVLNAQTVRLRIVRGRGMWHVLVGMGEPVCKTYDFVTFSEALAYFLAALTGKETPA
jgi:hypothetical protein